MRIQSTYTFVTSCLVLLLSAQYVGATTYTSNGSGNFRSISWTPSNPGDFDNITGDKFIIRDGDAVVLASDISVEELEVGEGGAGATFTIGNDGTGRALVVSRALTVLANSNFNLGGNSATHTVEVTGDIVHAGSTFDLNSGTDVASLTLSNSTSSVISGNTLTLNDLTINGRSSIILVASLVVNGDFIADSTGTDISTAVNHDFYGDFSLLNGATFTADAWSVTDFLGGAQLLNIADGATFYGVLIDNGTKTVIGNFRAPWFLEISDDGAIADSTSTNSHTIATLEVKNRNGILLDSSTVTFNRSNIRFGDNTNTDGNITLGNEVNVIINSWCNLERDDTLTIDGDLSIIEDGYLVLNGTSSSPAAGEADSKLIVTGSRTLTLDANRSLFVRGYDNFPTGFANYSLAVTSLVRYDRDYDQIIRSESSAGVAINFGRLYLAQGDGVSRVKRNLHTSNDTLLLSGQFDQINGVEFEVGHSATMIVKEDMYMDDGTTAGSPVFDAGNTVLILDANRQQVMDGPISGNYSVATLRITNSESPTAIRRIYIDDNISIEDAFIIENPNGSASNTTIVDIDDNQIFGNNGEEDTFTLGAHCIIYTSSNDDDGFAEGFDDDDPADIVTIDSLSTVRFDLAGNQSIPNFNGGTFGTIEFSGSGNKYVRGALNIKGNVSRVGGNPVFRFGTLFFGAENYLSYSHTVAGDWNMGAAFTGDDESGPANTASPTITFNGADQVISASDFHNISFAGSGTKTITGALLIDGNVTIGDGVTVDAGNEAIDVAGNWSETGTGTFTQTGSITDFNGGTTQTIATNPSSSFNSLYVTNSSTLDVQSTIQAGFHLFIEGNSTLDMSGDTVKIKKDFYINSNAIITYADPTNSVVVMNGETEQNLRMINASEMLPTLVFENSGNKELVNNTLTVEGDLTISSESTFDARWYQVNFMGSNWNNNGTFQHQNSVNFLNTTGTVTVSTSTFHDIDIGDGTNPTSLLLSGNISCDGELNIFNNSTLDVSASNYSVTVEESWNNYGAFNPRQGTVTFVGSWTNYRTDNGSGGTQADKNFYNLTINIDPGIHFLVQRGGVVLNDRIDVLNDLRLVSGNFSLYDNANIQTLYVGGDLINEGGDFLFYHENHKIVMNGSSGTHSIDLGGDQVRDFEIDATGATYELTGDFLVRDNTNNEFTMTAGTLDLNGRSLTINRGGIDMSGGTLLVNEGSSLIINDLATDPDFNKTGGTLEVVGLEGEPATFGAADAGGFTFTQSGGDIQARYYTISSTSGDGIRIEGGTIDGSTTGNNFSDGTFTSGTGTSYMTLANISLGALSANNVVFNAGPTNNVAVDGSNLPTGTFEFVIAGGTLAGAQDESDVPDGGATTGYVLWNEDAGLTWIGGSSTNWSDAANWSDPSDVDADNIPDADDIVYLEAGSSFNPIITTSDSFSIARLIIRNAGDLTFQGAGKLNVAGNFTNFSGCTVDMTDDPASRLYVAGAWSNNGTFNEGSATVVFNGTDGIHSITTNGNGDPFYNLTVAGGDSVTYTLGSVVTVSNAFELRGGTCDASSGFNFFINKDWLVEGGIFEPGQSLVRFNGTSGSQSISGGTLYSAYFEGAATKSIDGNIAMAADVTFVSGTGNVSGNDRTIFVGRHWDLDQTDAFVPGTGTVIFNGTSTQLIESDNNHDLTFNNIIFQNSATKRIQRSTTVNGNFSVISENAFVDIFTGGVTVNITGTLSQTGGTLRIWDSNFPTAGEYSLTGGIVEYLQDGAMSVQGNITYNDLYLRALNNTDTEATLQGDITVNDDVLVHYGNVTFNVNGHTITLADAFNLDNTDSMAWNGGGIVHTGEFFWVDNDFNTTSRRLGSLSLQGSSTKQFNSNVVMEGNLTVGDGVRMYQSLYTITSDGDDTLTFESNAQLDVRVVGTGFPTGFAHYEMDPTSQVEFRASGDQTIFTNSGNLEYGLIYMYNTGTLTMDGDLTAHGNLVMNNNPTLQDGGNNLTLNGAYIDLRDYIPTAGTRVTFSGSGDQFIIDNDGSGFDFDLEKVTFSGGGTKTIYPNNGDETININDSITIASGVTVLFNYRGVNFSGEVFQNNGTINAPSTTYPFSFTGGNATIDPGTNSIGYLSVNNSTGTTVTVENNGFNIENGAFAIAADAEIDFGSLTHTIASNTFTIDPAGSWILGSGGNNATLTFDRAGTQVLPILDSANANITGVPNITTATSGTKQLSGNILVNDVTIAAATNIDVINGSDYQMTVNGSWICGGDFVQRDGTVIFNSVDTTSETITTNNELFSQVIFQGDSSRRYTMTDDMWILGNTSGNALSLSSATLDLNGNTLTLGNNDANDPDAELNIIGNGGVLEVDAGAILQFSCADDGGDDADTEIGGNLDVQSGGRLRIVGDVTNVASVARYDGGERIDINIESGGEIEAQYYNIQYLTDEGLEVEDGAILDPDNLGNNFSNGAFSQLATDAGNGTGGDDNPVSGNRYLTLEMDDTVTISNVVFGFGGTPTVGSHYNVTRSNAGGNDSTVFRGTSGPLGRNGGLYEDDGDATTPAAYNGQLRWEEPTDTRWTGGTSTDWYTASNWDNGVPSIASNDVEAVIALGSPFNPTITDSTVNISALIIEDGIIKLLDSAVLDIDGDVTLGDGSGGALIMDSTANLLVEGSWTTSTRAIFDNGDGTVTFDANAGSNVTINPGTINFHHLKFSNATNAGDFSLSASTLTVEGDLTIENSAKVIPTLGGYNFYVAGDINGTGGEFDQTVDGEVILNGANQTITAMEFDELTASGSGTKSSQGTISINDYFIIESGVVFTGNGDMNLASDVFIYGTFNGVSGQTYYMSGVSWIADPNSWTGQGTVDFNRVSGTQYIRQHTSGDNPVEFHNLVFTGGARIQLGLINAGQVEDGNVDVTGDVNITNSINQIVTQTYTIDNTSGTGTFTLGAGEAIYINGSNNFPSGFATYDLDPTSLSLYYGTIDQTIRGGVGYGNLILLYDNTKTLGGNIEINGYLQVRGSTLDASTGNYSINLAGNWITNWGNDDGQFIARSGTVTFDGDGQQLLYPGETGTQEFHDVVVNKPSGIVEVGVSNVTIGGDLNVFNGTFDINGHDGYVAGNMNASGTGAFAASGNGTYMLNASSGTPTISGNGTSIAGSIEINAPGRTYELVGDLTLTGNFTVTSGTLDLNGQTLSVGDYQDVVSVSGTLNVSTTAKPGGTLRLGNQVSLSVQAGGAINIVGTPTEVATVTSTGTTQYLFSVAGTPGNEGRIGARYYVIEYLNEDGLFINSNTLISTTNNFSDGIFQNGAFGGKYLRIENTQNLTDGDRIENIIFDDNPGGGATNINKISATTGNIQVFNYSGGFAGPNDEEDPNDLIEWLAPPTVTWTGTVSSDWFTGGNWDSNTVPLITQDVIIPQTLNEPVIDSDADTAFAKNVTLQVNSVLKINSADQDTVDLRIDGDFNFEASASLICQGTEDDIEVGGGWIVLSSAFFTPATSRVVLNSTDGIENLDNISSFYDLIIDVAGTVSLASDLSVTNSFSIDSGTLDLSSYDMTLGGTFTNAGTLNAKTQTISLIPSSTTTPISFDPGSSSLYNLVIGQALGNDVEYDLGNNLVISHDFSLIKGELDLNGYNLTIGNDDGTQDAVRIYDTLWVGANETVSLDDDVDFSVEGGGDFRLTGADQANTALLTNVTGRYDFTVKSGGRFLANHFKVEFIDNEGLWLQAGSVLEGLDNGIFDQGSGASYYLRSSNAFASDITATNLTFNSGPTNSVRRNEGAGNNLIFLDAQGAASGEALELDDGSASTGEIRWTYTNPLTVWTGASDSLWNNAANWDNGIPSSVNTVRIPNVSPNPMPVINSSTGSGNTASLTILSGGVLTIYDDETLTVVDELTNDGTIIIISGGTVSVGNSWTNNGTFDPGTSTTTLSSDANVTISGGGNFYNLIIDGAGTGAGVRFTSSSALVVENDFTILDGVYEVLNPSHTTTVGGDLVVDDTNGSFIDNLSTVTFNGASQNIGSASENTNITLNNVTLSGTGTKTLLDSLGVQGDLSIGAGVTFALGDKHLEFSGNNFDVDGTIDVSGGTSTVVFNGTAIQVITGNVSEFSLDNLVISNTAAGNSDIQLGTDININNNVNFLVGLVRASSSNPLTFNDGATVSFDGAEETSPMTFPGTDVDGNSYVVGPVHKIGDDDFIFPIGDGARIARLGISNIQGSPSNTDEYSSEFFHTPHPNRGQPKGGGMTHVSAIEYWDLSNVNGHGGHPYVTLFWDATSFAPNPAVMSVAHYTGGTWQDEGNGSYTGNQTAGSVTSSTPWTSFSPAAHGSSDGGLPVELSSFTGYADGNNVMLDWTTASELDNDYFEVHYSVNGVDFERIGTVTGQGTTSFETDYSFEHRNPLIGANYYRLKQVDFDGKFEYSDIIMIRMRKDNGSDSEFSIYPNPSTERTLSLRGINLDAAERVNVEVFDLFGRMVLSSTHISDAQGEMNESLSFGNELASGTYTVRISAGNLRKNIRLILK